MEFNWEEFKASNNIAVHCKTEEEAIDFCRRAEKEEFKWQFSCEVGLKTKYKEYKERMCYRCVSHKDLNYGTINYYKEKGYTILEWSNYMNQEKENRMNLELNNLTDEQKKQIIELAKKFEQENEVDKLNIETDYRVICGEKPLNTTHGMSLKYAQDHFILGLTAHTKEEAEKIRRRLLVEKELRDWAKKCKEPVDLANGMQKRWKIDYCLSGKFIGKDYCCNYASTLILFTEEKIIDQAIKSIGQERLIKDYFGIEREDNHHAK